MLRLRFLFLGSFVGRFVFLRRAIFPPIQRGPCLRKGIQDKFVVFVFSFCWFVRLFVCFALGHQEEFVVFAFSVGWFVRWFDFFSRATPSTHSKRGFVSEQGIQKDFVLFVSSFCCFMR